MKKVLIPTKLDAIAAETLEAHEGFCVVQDAETGLETLVDAHPDAYALIVRSDKVTSGIIDRLPGLKVIVRAGAGYNTIDIKHARSRGVDVMNTPGANEPTARLAAARVSRSEGDPASARALPVALQIVDQ